jgi:hypothetical protein
MFKHAQNMVRCPSSKYRSIDYGYDTIAPRTWRGTVYQRKDGHWSASFYLENGKRKTVHGKTREEAYEKLQKALLEHSQGLMITGPKQTGYLTSLAARAVGELAEFIGIKEVRQ